MTIEDKEERAARPPDASVAQDLKHDSHANPTAHAGQEERAPGVAPTARKSQVSKRSGKSADIDGPDRQQPGPLVGLLAAGRHAGDVHDRAHPA